MRDENITFNSSAYTFNSSIPYRNPSYRPIFCATLSYPYYTR